MVFVKIKEVFECKGKTHHKIAVTLLTINLGLIVWSLLDICLRGLTLINLLTYGLVMTFGIIPSMIYKYNYRKRIIKMSS